jgi:ABC-2 type transport system ATP-binding protein
VLFLDEPTTGLDPKTRSEVWAFVEELVGEGTTVLLTTQYMEEAERLAHQIVVLDTGRVIATGTADELKRRFGASVLEVRVAARSDLDRAAAVVAERTGAKAHVDLNTQTVTVPIHGGTGLLLEAGRRLGEEGIVLDDLGIRRPSLDDVFLLLTGATTGGVPTHGGAADQDRASGAGRASLGS